MDPLVSVLIPVYNCERWVGCAIETALSQTWSNKEVIVLDDRSSDGTLAALEPYRSSIRIEHSDTTRGQNISRNALTAMSRGEWLVFLDADDELAADSIEKKMLCAERNDAVYGSKEVATFRDGERCGSIRVRAEDYDDPFVAAFHWKYPNTSSFLFKRTSLLEAGGWDEGVENCTDYSLYLPMLLHGQRFRAAPEAWSLYRQWTSQQAVNIAPLRKMQTRLEIMRDTAFELMKTARLTPIREQAFLDASLQVIRTMFPLDRMRAQKEHETLLEWNREFKPSIDLFPQNYRRIYGYFGFRAAEFVAETLRPFNRRKASNAPFQT